MKRSWTRPVGLALILLGAVWAAQGFGWLKGSSMTGETLWAVIGPIVMVLGLVLVLAGTGRTKP
jgi:hypothetical protein